ncbi:LacI family transcriptional regulator [Halanaerobium saccharolyticum]|uniref:LacI family transcriptional regulator n=1 Tax=Halanaerobium saccharolyticum TaxID=43595 RepID=A0A4R7Z2F1_9FIRM|nr:LacI family DNA-binding transcriptional regulator [Halanaerobium saccharolyticum]RAK07874.1 LacI family transcriptional regulator [Halanaerobium saccharolyticum]TDW04488.1 LacI family transcriptional regulator [Halanaerobium saccharolyticum]TDX59824.1 LacI family transcriptional regulator [Halanaerobium saccharolyticum]
MNVTIKDIAEKADVSISTVSKSLNDKGGVSPVTRQKVLNIAKEMGYFSFRSQAGLKTHNIAFIMSRRHIPIFNNPFYTRVIAGVEIEVENYDYNLLFSTIKLDALQSKKVPSIISQNKVDGLILAGADINKNMIRAIEELKFPTVLVDNYLRSPIMDSIVSDNFNGAMQAVDYLIRMGHHKIAYAGGPNSHPSFEERYRAYKMEMLESDLEIQENFIKIKEDFSQDMGKELAKEFLKEKQLPTAIFAANDATAIGLLQTFNKYGVKVPADISIIGFDNIELTAFTTPKITTISIDKEGMGQEAARKLFDRIQNPEKKSTKSVITTELIERESVKKIKSS